LLDNRFWSKVDKTDFCWNWIGCLYLNGYGQFWSKGKKILAHRFSYEFLKEKIPKGLEIDHLCRNRKCVNPEHLEAVTHQQNMLRGTLAQRTHCINGHEYVIENTYFRKSGGKQCRTCSKLQNHNWHITNHKRNRIRKRQNYLKKLEARMI